MPGSTLVSAFSFSKDFRHIAYRGTGANAYAEIYAESPGSGKPVQLTHVSQQLQGSDTAKREVVEWKSSDGSVVEGVLVKPVDFDSHKRYPLLVVISCDRFL